MGQSQSVAARRLAGVRASMAEHDLDGVLVSYLPNIRYLTGFSGSHAWLLLGSERGVFITDGRYGQQAEEELPGSLNLELRVPPERVLAEVARTAAELWKDQRVGFEGRHLTHSDWEKLTGDAASVEWAAVANLVEDIRARKDEEEIAAMRKAAAIAATALEETLQLIAPGIREFEIANELDYRMRRLGAEGPAFDTIVASGERSALPHAGTGERATREGDLLLCDFGARWKGYCCDLTRTFVVGKPQPRQLEVYDLVLAAQKEACAALSDGAMGGAVDEAARGVFAEHDLEECFRHSTGHGLGLEVHEGPRLSRESEDRLVANMVVTVEPGLYFPGWGGVRIEDDLVVTLDRPLKLSDLDSGSLRELPI
jgi:Xaa-Pro aminopeptidase